MDDALNEFKPARFPIELGLPSDDAGPKSFQDAADAVAQEFRDCSKWKRLKCYEFSVVAESARGIVYVVHVGKSVEFDWTWEGAVAFRPTAIDDQTTFRHFDIHHEDSTNQIVWSGEILEVDEQNGCLFISLNNPDAIPTKGSFFVRPFEFLATLHSVYRDEKFETIQRQLPSRLLAACGGIHPPVKQPQPVGLPNLKNWWAHSWTVLWGPPGTGKTYTSGQQIASALDDPDERILVVSTTNKATDAIALSIGQAALEKCLGKLANGQMVRIGKGAAWHSFADRDLSPMLRGTEAEMLSRIDGLTRQLRSLDSSEDKAFTRRKISSLKSNSNDQGNRQFIDPDINVVVATVFKAMRYLENDTVATVVEQGEAPFTTIFIDEAGLISRAAVAALSMLASRRVVLVGDSKQLAPISRISRLLPTRQATWLASSALSHLDELESAPTAVHVLAEQRRMHPDVCKVVSDYQYKGFLKTAGETLKRDSKLPQFIAGYARAIWYVLDEEGADLASIRAQRGPGNKSWVRPVTQHVLQKLFEHPEVRAMQGLFISPYKAQAQSIAGKLAKWGAKHWEASTVHSQQGSEADLVIFDTVNAGSFNWPFEEWKRLVNVALSRAREAVIVLASRAEMDEPYLQPLQDRLTAGVLVKTGTSAARWQKQGDKQTLRYRKTNSSQQVHEAPKQTWQLQKKHDSSMGHQIADRKSLRPVLSQEQQRLSNLELDGKPRLVRGVAGSGKSIVLSTWLAKTVRKQINGTTGKSDLRIWAVYANRALHKLLQDSIESAWRHAEQSAGATLFGPTDFPWQKVSLLHVKEVLSAVLPEAGLTIERFQFDYDRAAEEFLERKDLATLEPRCDALFIDEAQDMGPATLKLLLGLVTQSDTEDPNSRPAHIFYDNAQNVYSRATPRWTEFGLDMRGRSTIMRESFRSTRPVTELAVNVFDRLTRASGVPESTEQVEQLSLGLIERTRRNEQDWLRVRFNSVAGPKPIFQTFDDVETEMQTLANHIIHLVAAENVSPEDICILYNGKSVADQVTTMVGPPLGGLDIELSVQTGRSFERRENTIVVTTPHSFKGYEAEVVFIPRADQFVTGQGKILANALYVAMTRARSLLAVYSQNSSSQNSNSQSSQSAEGTPQKRINDALISCIECLNHAPTVESATSQQDDFLDVLAIIGNQHRKWLLKIWTTQTISQEPITDTEGNAIAQPLFWFINDTRTHACFADPAETTGAPLPFEPLRPGDSI